MPFQLYTVNHLTHDLRDVGAAADLAHLQEDSWWDTPGVHSLVVLSTCNRVEVYVSADPEVILLPVREEVSSESLSDSGGAGCGFVSSPVSARGGLTGVSADVGHQDASLAWNFLEGRDVAEHLFRVASGLDSMVVGEAEIAGQVRRAFTRAQTRNTVKGLMVRMFQGALSTSRQVSAQTELTGLGRSVVSVALDLAGKSMVSCRDLSGFDAPVDWSSLKVVLLGSGAYAGTSVAQLRARGAANISSVETSSRVRGFAQSHGTKLVSEIDLVDTLARSDLVVSCRGVGTPVLTRELLSAAMDRRVHLGKQTGNGGSRADFLIILDLALLHDVESEVRQIPGLTLWDLDDIRRHVPALAVSEIQRANNIIEGGLKEYDAAVAARHMDPAIVQLRKTFMEAADSEIAALPKTDTIPLEVAQQAIRHVVAKLAHTPTVSAHMAAQEGLGEQWVDALATVWGLTPEVLESAFTKRSL